MDRSQHAPRIMIVEGRFYEDIVDELVRGATTALEEAGAEYERLGVPGAFEIPAAIAITLRAMEQYPKRRHFDGYMALGCVIRGETSHYDYVCGESARALQDLAVNHCLALGYGIVTVDSREQAWARAAVDGKNKGGDAARTCLAMIDLKRQFDLYAQ